MEKKYYALTPAQMTLFFSQKYTVQKQVNNICTSVLVDQELDFDILKKSIQKAYERNDCLRIRIVKVGKDMKQYFERYEEPEIEYLDFRGKTFEEMEKKLYKFAHKRISNFGESMSKIFMMHSFDGKCGIYFVVSHMIMDSWAISTFYKDILSIYEALKNDTEMPKPLYAYEELLMEELNYKNT
ncbi:MAG TPA: condensation domain-containing protein, partial [Tissierellaceae bacterium]|nr:condensation domain-containing protein [Tissierellaceae bacterium]